MAVGCFPSSSPSPPAEYEPLPVIATSPLLLHDTDETRDYLNRFPWELHKRYEVPGAGHYFIDDIDDAIKRHVVAGEQWEPYVVELSEQYVEPDSVVVEVGAHIGTHTVPMAGLVGPWGRVYAFEPQRKIHRELHHNLALNGVINAVPLRFAIGAGETRIIEMNPPRSGNEGGTGIGTGGDAAELRTLDSFGFERVSLLKIDVEGYEDEVLEGAADTIRRNRPTIIIEIMGGKVYKTASPRVRARIEGTWKRLEALGYTVKPVRTHDYLALPDAG